MNLYRKIKDYFYQVNPRSSSEQLQMDFGGFSPSPLRSSDLLSEFMIVTVRGNFGLFIIFLKNLKSEFEKLQRESINSPKSRLSSSWESSFSFQKNIDNNVIFKSLKLVLEGLVLFLGLIVFLMVSPLLLSYLIFKLVTLFSKYKKRFRESGGVFDPSEYNSQKIFVFFKNKYSLIEIKKIVSHEHLHLLQFRSGNFAEPGLNRLALIPEQFRQDKLAQYYFDKREIEVRLHELVLSYFGYSKELPTTLTGFIELLIGDSVIGEDVHDTVIDCGINVDIERVVLFETRGDQRESKEIKLLIALTSKTSAELRNKFILEILPTMYGNLLKYYGNPEGSSKFFSQIPRPNAYDIYFSD